MAQWAEIAFSEALFTNSDETLLSKAMASMENCYGNAAGGQTRFPGLDTFCSFDGPASTRTYLWPYRNSSLIAVTDHGRVYRIGKTGSVEDVTGVPVSGGKRPAFTENEDALIVAAGGPILQLRGATTQVLSTQAPNTTHVAFLAGYLLAIEPFSGRFRYCDPGQYESWPDLNLLTAEGKPDDLTALLVTPFNEVLFCGADSIEQWEPTSSGTQPFRRRWATGESLARPYTGVALKSGTYGVNSDDEFVKYNLQSSETQSDDIQLQLETVDDWSESWASKLHIAGRKFIILQIPHATNGYGTKGLTFLLDYEAKRWTTLWGWDSTLSLPTRWPGWSVAKIWGRVFVGVEGGVAELKRGVYSDRGSPMRMVARTGHVDKFGPSRIDDFKIRIKRGVTQSDGSEGRFGLRVNRNNRGWSRTVWRSFGAAGQSEMTMNFGALGIADTWQFEYQVVDPVQVEFVGAQALVERVGW